MGMIDKAIQQIYKTSGYIKNGVLYIWVDGEFVKQDSAKSVNDLVAVFINNRKIEEVKKELMELVDYKQENVYKFVLGYKATKHQIERYKDKYERAKSGEFSINENKVIIEKFEIMRNVIRGFVDLIELFRGNVDDLIVAGELDMALRLIHEAKSFSQNTTKQDIEKLFE